MKLLVSLMLFAVALGGLSVTMVGMVNRTHALGWNRKLVDVLTLACGLLMVLGVWPLWQFAAGEHYPALLPALPPVVAGTIGWTAVAVAVLALTHNAWRWLHPERRGGVLKRTATALDLGTPNPAEWLAPGLPRFVGTLPLNEVLHPLLVETDLLVPDLPPAFHRLKIAHLTDLHMSGRIDRAYFDRVVEVTNAHEPDLVAITGDIVERAKCLDWIDESLAHLQAKHAKLFVLGNHDVMAGPAEIRARLVAGGFIDAGGKVEKLALPGGSCVVAGNEMPWFGPAPEVSAESSREATRDEFRLALLHTPDHFAWAQRHGFHVALAGHNHGGQVRFPILGALLAPSVYGTRFAAGVFRAGGTVMHVSPGTSSLTPMRWNCHPELNILTLHRAES